jgi:hypothetical protein
MHLERMALVHAALHRAANICICHLARLASLYWILRSTLTPCPHSEQTTRYFLWLQVFRNVSAFELLARDGPHKHAAFIPNELDLVAVKLRNKAAAAIIGAGELVRNDREVFRFPGHHILDMRSRTDPGLYAREIRILVSSASLASSQTRSWCASQD